MEISPRRRKIKTNYVLKDDSGSETAAFAFNPMKLGHMEDGHMSSIAQEPMKHNVSIAWNQNTMHGLIVKEMATALLIDTPFCFNTGATSHISPFKLDFVKLGSIEPKEIHGVNGASIPVIGVSV